MVKLGIGLLLWWLAHSFKRVFPAMRRDLAKTLGEGATKGLVSLALLAALVLIVIGYRQAPIIALYAPLPGMGHVNNLLMLIALFAIGIGPAGGRLAARFRHPMLWSVVIWAVSHLLVNGDLASVVMFGSLGLWALVQVRLINQHEGPWERPMPGNALQDYKLALSALFGFVVIAGIHWLFGFNPFLGSYG
ncbi:MAG: NnrU family protein [Paracoccaceae bacterium]